MPRLNWIKSPGRSRHWIRARRHWLLLAAQRQGPRRSDGAGSRWGRTPRFTSNLKACVSRLRGVIGDDDASSNHKLNTLNNVKYYYNDNNTHR